MLWEENSQDQRSIASITKMMTAVVFMETNPDLNTPVTVTRQDTFQASTTHIRVNDQVTADDLLNVAGTPGEVTDEGLRRQLRLKES